MPTQSEPRGDRPDPGLNVILSERRQLISLAYRLLGSLSDAEDVVQETYARWYAMTREQQQAIESPGALADDRVQPHLPRPPRFGPGTTREVRRASGSPSPSRRDRSGSADGRRARPVDPADRVTLDESISMAFLVVLESMSPAERVAFVLHDVFRYSFAEVAEVVGRTPGACRQLASSARRRIQQAGAPATPPARRTGLVREFKDAWEAKDIEALVGLLDPEATTVADGGGLVSAVLEPIDGGRRSRGRSSTSPIGSPDMVLVERTVNGQPGLVRPARRRHVDRARLRLRR